MVKRRGRRATLWVRATVFNHRLCVAEDEDVYLEGMPCATTWTLCDRWKTWYKTWGSRFLYKGEKPVGLVALVPKKPVKEVWAVWRATGLVQVNVKTYIKGKDGDR